MMVFIRLAWLEDWTTILSQKITHARACLIRKLKLFCTPMFDYVTSECSSMYLEWCRKFYVFDLNLEVLRLPPGECSRDGLRAIRLTKNVQFTIFTSFVSQRHRRQRTVWMSLLPFVVDGRPTTHYYRFLRITAPGLAPPLVANQLIEKKAFMSFPKNR